MKSLNYPELKIQEYLLSQNFTTDQKKTLFKWRVRAERFGDNFRGGKDFILCPLCQNHPDSQEWSYGCSALLNQINIEGHYSEIFNDKIYSHTIRTIDRITKMRKQILKL